MNLYLSLPSVSLWSHFSVICGVWFLSLTLSQSDCSLRTRKSFRRAIFLPPSSCDRERSIPPGSLRRVSSLWWYSQGEYWHLFSPSWIWKRCLVAPTLTESVQSALIASRIILFHFPFLKVTVHPFLPSNPVQINLTLLLRNSDQIKVFLCRDDNSGASKFHAEMTSSYI